MKRNIMTAVITVVCSGFLLPAFCQKNYYVVVGAFSTDGHVKDFTTQLPSLDIDTAYAYNDNGNMLQVYVWRTRSQALASSKASSLQNAIEANTAEIRGDYESISISDDLSGKKVITRKDNITSKDFKHTDLLASSLAPPSIPPAIPHTHKKGALFRFTITNHAGEEIDGHVHNVDFNTGREFTAYKSKNYVDLSPYAKHETISLTCGIFGYKFSEKSIDYSDPALIEGAYKDENNAWVIPYRLERLEKGDVSIMYNVSFHKDAVIMMSHSKTDLEELVKMMSENPNYAITIHGHCNGKNSRKIIAMGAEQQFFDVNGSQEIYATAKQLSHLRSQAIKNYLLENGIGESRIKTYAWGGSDMIADKFGPFSKLNDRIEIEIRKH